MAGVEGNDHEIGPPFRACFMPCHTNLLMRPLGLYLHIFLGTG